jgi:hypothetical protein
VKSVFSIITLFTLTDRTQLADTLENLHTMIDFYGMPTYSQNQLISPFYIQNDGWLSDKIETVISLLKDRSFFCRFSPSHLVT